MPPIVDTITVKMIVGRIAGTVILVSCWKLDAPSRDAASYRSLLTACIAAR